MAIFGAPGGSLLANFQTTNFGITVTQVNFESLFRYDAKLNLVPWLAEAVDISPDGRTYTFRTRKGVKWSDGQPFTARDVESSVMAMADPASATNWISFVEEIVGVTERKAGKGNDIPGIQVVDDNTIKITTNQPSAVFLDLFGTNFMVTPKHVMDTIKMDQLAKSEFLRQPTVSTGPFRLVKYTTNQLVEFERNPNYWGPAPKLDKIFVKILTPESAIAALQRGEVDVIPGEISGELPPNDAVDLKANPEITVTSYPNTNTETLYLNLKTLFSDVRARQAVAYAIDREQIVKQALRGFGHVAYSVFPEFSPFYLSTVNKYLYNPDKAKQLLKDAGWDSSKVANWVAPTGDTTRDQVATIVQQFLQAVGLNSRFERVDFATSVDRLTHAHTFDLGQTQNRGFNNLDVSRRFACRMLDAGVNAGGYCNTKLDQLMTDARGKARLEDQKPLVNQIQQIINDDVPTVMLYYRDSIGAVNTKKIGGAVPRYGGVQLDVANWFLR